MFCPLFFELFSLLSSSRAIKEREKLRQKTRVIGAPKYPSPRTPFYKKERKSLLLVVRSTRKPTLLARFSFAKDQTGRVNARGGDHIFLSSSKKKNSVIKKKEQSRCVNFSHLRARECPTRRRRPSTRRASSRSLPMRRRAPRSNP